MHTALRFRYLVHKLRHHLHGRKLGGISFLSNAVRGRDGKRALLVHLIEPFFDRKIDVRHQNRWQARELGRLLREKGFQVDVLLPGSTVPPGLPPYDCVIDLHPGMSAYPTKSNTKRIAYITGSNPAFSNDAEKRRIEEIENTRGVHLRPRRQALPFSDDDLGTCDAMFFIGNAQNLSTYHGLRLPPVHQITNFAYPTQCTSRTTKSDGFLFLASGGQVHKGLHLLLEVFTEHPAWSLHVCSAFHQEPDFCRAYRHELFGLPNVFPHGFVKLDSSRFAQVIEQCSFVALPSCSEANAGSVISGMAVGLIPVVSKECGFSAEEVRYFSGDTTQQIAAELDACTRLADHERRRLSNLAVHHARTRYSPECFTSSLQSALTSVLG